MRGATRWIASATITLLMLMLCRVCLAQAPVPVPWPDVILDQRNYQYNIQATDRYWYYESTQQHPAIEFPADPPVVQILYMQGENVVVKVRWRNWNSFELNGTLTWQAARLEVPGPNYTDPGPHYLNLTVPSGSVVVKLLPNGGTFETTLTLTGTPAYVAVGGLQVKFNMPLTDGEGWGNNGTNGNFIGFERICFTRSLPIAPMSVPWADLAEYSCRWSFGFSSYEDVRREMTRGMHYSAYSPWNRNRYTAGAPIVWEGTPADVVDLSAYLGQIGEPWVSNYPYTYWASMDCRDFTALLKFALAVHGVEGEAQKIKRSTGNGSFSFWPVCPAGSDATAPPWQYWSGTFNYHYTVISDAMHYDPAAAYWFDIYGLVWYKPGYDWHTNAYWQNPAGGGVYYGLCYDDATPAAAPWADNSQQGVTKEILDPVLYE